MNTTCKILAYCNECKPSNFFIGLLYPIPGIFLTFYGLFILEVVSGVELFMSSLIHNIKFTYIAPMLNALINLLVQFCNLFTFTMFTFVLSSVRGRLFRGLWHLDLDRLQTLFFII